METVRRSGLPERKGQHVGAAVLMPILTVQPPHTPVAHERHAHIGGRLTDTVEHGLRQAQDPLSTDRDGADGYLNGNRH